MSSTMDRPAAVPSSDGELDVAGIGRAIARRKMWVVWPTLACLLGSVAFVALVTPKYTASSSLIIENQESFFTRPGGVTPGASDNSQSAPIDPEAVASQVQVATSRDLGLKAIGELGLRGNPEFDPTAKAPGLLSGLFGGGEQGSVDDRILENFLEQLNVFVVVKSRVLQVEFSSRDPALAARAANKVADLYINSQSDAKRDSARAAAESLASLISNLRTKVSVAESASEEFRATHGLTIGANNITMNGQQLSDLNQSLGLAKAAQAETTAKSKSLREMLKDGRLGDVTDVSNNELIRRLSETRATLRGQIASESRTLMPGHPRIKELNAQLGELDSEIRLAAERAARTLENDAKVAGVRVDNLLTAIAQQKKEVGGASDDEAHARELDRVAKELKDQLESNMTKYQEATAREKSESTPGDARIVSRAIAPLLPSFPKKAPIIAFSTVAGLLLSAGTVVSAELMSGRAYGPGVAAPIDEAAEINHSPIRRAPTPAPVETPMMASRRPRRSEGGEQVPDAMTGLVARLLAEPEGEYAQRVVVTTEADEVSARAAAAAIGRALARDRRVILVELDDRLGERTDAAGLGDILAGSADFEEAIYREPGARMHVLPAGREAFGYDENCAVIIDALSRTYDFVVLVAPPLGDSEVALSVAPDCECAVLACADEPNDLAMDELTHAGAGAVVAIPRPASKTGRTAA